MPRRLVDEFERRAARPGPVLLAVALGAAVVAAAPTFGADSTRAAAAAAPPIGALIEIDAARRSAAATDDAGFDAELRDGYLRLARDAYARGSYGLAVAYADRASASLRGSERPALQPTVAARGPDADLIAARADLVAMLEAGGRAAAPDAAADAQTAFDCAVMERGSDGGDAARAQECARELERLMSDASAQIAAAAAHAEAAQETAEPAVAPADLQRDLASAIAEWTSRLVAGAAAAADDDAPVAAVAPDLFAEAPRIEPSDTPAPAQQALERAPERFEVYFGVSSTVLDAEARAALDARIGAALADRRRLSVRVEGHADRSGDPAMNARLAAERAAEVRAFIEDVMARSPRPSTIDFDVASLGEGAPAVATPDGVREARNRRVVIELR